MKWLGEKLCGLFGGHNNVAIGEENTWRLLCTNCGAKTAGWTIETHRFNPPITQQQLDRQQLEVLNDMLDTELELHRGG